MEEGPKRKRAHGSVYVAKYRPGRPLPLVPTPGCTNVLMHTSASGLGGPLSPYVLRDEQGQLLENVWQFSKLYRKVTAQRIPLGRYHPDTIVWEHPAEVHVDEETGDPTPAYWEWRRKGMGNERAVRYPNGFAGRTQCVCSIMLDDNGNTRLGYIEARKRIYCAEYARLAPRTDAFKKLHRLLTEQGRDIQLVEVDGPDPKDFGGVTSLLMDEALVRRLVNDPKRPFGHGYVIAALLLGGQAWLE